MQTTWKNGSKWNKKRILNWYTFTSGKLTLIRQKVVYFYFGLDIRKHLQKFPQFKSSKYGLLNDDDYSSIRNFINIEHSKVAKEYNLTIIN